MRRHTVAALAAALALVPAGVAVPSTPPVAGQEPPRLAGQLLVATDGLRDPRFSRTVVYMVRHAADGAMGLVVNRPLGDTPLARLLERFGLRGEGVTGSLRVFYGGPVEAGRGFVLHTADWTSTDSLVVGGGIALTADQAVLDFIAHGQGPRRSLLALGYAGWGPGQLEGEIQGGAWISVAADEALVFDADYATKWERAMARRKISI